MAGFDLTQTSQALIVSPSTIPTLPTLSLSEEEQKLIQTLQSRATTDRAGIELENAFYLGEQTIENLRIAIPDEIARKLKTLVGWARIAVDPYVERLSCQGFRLPDATDVDSRLQEVWDANGLDAEQSLGYTDSLAMRRSYAMVGSDPDGGEIPRITFESPLNMTVLWDTSGRRAKAALQTYKQDDQERAALMVPGQTVIIGQNEDKQWEIVQRDAHSFDFVPVVRMANNPRTFNRDGYSEITPELRSLIVNACQRSMGLAVASELYSVPRMLLLGAQLSDFQNPNGEVRKAWESYISLINILERDEEGQVPEVKQLTTYDPSVFTKVVEHLASQAAGILAAVPQDLGLYTEGNPTSVESFAAMESRRDRRAIRKQSTFGVALVEMMQMAMRFMNNGAVPREFARFAPDWASVSIESPGVTADAITKQVTAKIIPAQSDVTLKRLGYSAVERQQIEQDRGSQALDEIRQALQNAPTPAPEVPVTSGDAQPA